MMRHVPVDRQDLITAPPSAFNILMIGQGFGRGEMADAASSAWRLIREIAFGNVGRAYSGRISVFFDDDSTFDLGLTRSATGVFAIPAANKNALADHIKTLSIKDSKGTQWAGDAVWPPIGVAGLVGGVVLLLIKKTDARPSGELYQLEPSDGYPVPLAGVVVQGTQFWANVLARAVAQKFGGLYDEYSLPGDEFNAPPLGYALSAPNVFTVDVDTITKLKAIESQGGKPPPEQLRAALPILFPDRWKIDPSEVGAIFTRKTSDAINLIFAPKSKVDQRLILIEGGGHYRHNVLRGNFDCLLRRIPLGVLDPVPDGLKIQERVGLCLICTRTMGERFGKAFDFLANLSVSPTTQRREYQRTSWKNVTKRTPKAGESFTVTTTGTPKWSMTVTVDSTSGLTISDLQLTDRQHDPFSAHMPTVFKKITFGPFQAKLEDGTLVELDVAAALGNAKAPPVLVIAGSGAADPRYERAVELVLTFSTPLWWYEVTLSLVLKGATFDFDPGDALKVNKVYPQISMRWFKPTKKQRGGAAPASNAAKKVRRMTGQVNLTAVNAIPTSAKAELTTLGLDEMASGMQGMACFTDTNSTDDADDNSYTLTQVPNPNLALFGSLLGAPDPLFPFASARRISGRKLAGVVKIESAFPSTFAGGTARNAYLVLHRIPGLPMWSWLFDYGLPEAAPQSGAANALRFKAVYSPDDEDPADATKGQTPRTDKYAWPPSTKLDSSDDKAHPPLMKIRKEARQGEYDSVHRHPIHVDQPFTEAPFCGDACLHLHWRWGTIATKPARSPFRLLGWGDGRRGRGSNTTMGAVLIPPNQHLEIKATRINQGETEVDYIITANRPPIDAAQVVMEQGTAFGYTYDGLTVTTDGNAPRLDDVLGLALALGVISLSYDSKRNDLIEKFTNNRKQFDADIRILFHEIYEKIQFYDEGVDQLTESGVQQVPNGDDSSGSSKNPKVAPKDL